jgi:SAM-dependent methyltransferase
MRELRRENLAGLSGRVLEVGAGTGTNFELYPDSVALVVAVEPEQRLVGLAREAGAGAAFPLEVTNQTVESFSADEPFDAVVCSLVLCSVAEPDPVLRQLFSLLRPGGELRYLEHVASGGIRGRFQQLVDATISSPHRAGDPGCGVRRGQGPNRTGFAGLGTAAGVGVRTGPRPAPGLIQ